MTLTELYIHGDFEVLRTTPYRTHIISESTLRVLVAALNQSLSINCELVLISELGFTVDSLKSQLFDYSDLFRKQVVLQCPITGGVHYVALDIEVSFAGAKCLIMDASLNEECLPRIKRACDRFFDRVYCVGGCPEVMKLQNDYSSCPLFSVYHATQMALSPNLYEYLGFFLGEEKTIIPWVQLPAKFILPIQSLSRAQSYVQYHKSLLQYGVFMACLSPALGNPSAYQLQGIKSIAEQMCLLGMSIKQHKIVAEGIEINGYLTHLSNGYEMLVRDFMTVTPDDDLIDIAWSGQAFRCHKALAQNFVDIEHIGSFVDSLTWYRFLTNATKSNLRQAATSQCLSCEECRAVIVSGTVSFVDALLIKGMVDILSSEHVVSLISEAVISVKTALDLPPGRVHYLENINIVDFIRDGGDCLRILRLPTKQLELLVDVGSTSANIAIFLSSRSLSA